MRTGLALTLVTGLLAGCGQRAATGNMTGPTATPDPMEAKLGAASDVNRRVAFLRAVLDAGYQCRKVTKVENLPRDASGHPVWHVVCDEAADYTVMLVPGGIFNVSGVPGPTQPRFPKASATAAPR